MYQIEYSMSNGNLAIGVLMHPGVPLSGTVVAFAGMLK
jgi:hypothetical protein